MPQLINKDGLRVENNLKAVQEELFRGMGFVMGEKVSVFMQNLSLHEKSIVVSIENGTSVPTEKKFAVGRIKEAFEMFQSALKGSKD